MKSGSEFEKRGATVDKGRPCWPARAAGLLRAVVVLRHDEPGGGCHWDVLVARDSEGASGLMSLRLQERPDQAVAGAVLPAKITPDHDGSWLTREGPVSGDRGSAWRVRSGAMGVDAQGVAEIAWQDGGACRWDLGGDSKACHIKVLACSPA
jgi:hypothetical protein